MTTFLAQDSTPTADDRCPSCQSLLRSDRSCGPCTFVEANGTAAYTDAAARLVVLAADPGYRRRQRLSDLAVVRAWVSLARHRQPLDDALAIIAATDAEYRAAC